MGRHRSSLQSKGLTAVETFLSPAMAGLFYFPHIALRYLAAHAEGFNIEQTKFSVLNWAYASLRPL